MFPLQFGVYSDIMDLNILFPKLAESFIDKMKQINEYTSHLHSIYLLFIATPNE
jgi:hypothetical protein